MARSSRSRLSTPPKRRILIGTCSFAAIAAAMLGLPAHAQDLPQSARVVAGSAGITGSGPGLTVTQASMRAVIDWSSFNIAAGAAVDFRQPGPDAAILNRVTGSAPTVIAGQLTGNGQVYLVNPNGIALTATGAVKVGGGFVASTLDIGNEDFLAGRLRFAGKGASGEVSNAGTISVGPGGFAALLGGRVSNAGTISVPLGRIGLGAGETATLDTYGDGFLQVAIPNTGGDAGALIAMSGRLAGQRVELRTASARETLHQAINLPGTIEARGAHASGGEIVLDGGDGATMVAGTLDASGSDGSGGRIIVGGDRISLTSARLDASGSAGGAIAVGGGAQGRSVADLTPSRSLTVDSTSTIDASGQDGSGGAVTLWGGDSLAFAGTVTARGKGGNGGSAEISGKGAYDFTGKVDLLSEGGKAGDLLIDPYNVTISTAPASNQSAYTATGNNAVINTAALEGALGSANVTVSTGASGTQTGTITLSDQLYWTAATTLTLSAAGTIALNADVTAPSGGLTLSAGTSSSAITASGGIDVGTFTLSQGAWSQNQASLPRFLANNFVLSSNGSFLRAKGGSGTGGSPYQLADIYGVQGIGSSGTYLASAYQLVADVDASSTSGWNSGSGFNPIATNTGSSSFSGTLDGQGYSILNLTISRSASTTGVGLFGYVAGGAIRNLNVLNATVTGSGASGAYGTGIVVGAAGAGTTITNVAATGSVTGSGSTASYNIGGLVGDLGNGATLSNSAAGVTVNGVQDRTGGAVGAAESGSTITSVSATGAVNSTGAGVGGLVGWTGGGTIGDSWASGAVSGGTNAGGLVGAAAGTIATSWASGAVSGTAAGGLAGSNAGTISNSYWNSSTTATGIASGTTSGTTGLTTAQMKSAANFTGFDFSGTWYANASGTYAPTLRSGTTILGGAASGNLTISSAVDSATNVNSTSLTNFLGAGSVLVSTTNGTLTLSGATNWSNGNSLTLASSGALSASASVTTSGTGNIGIFAASGTATGATASLASGISVTTTGGHIGILAPNAGAATALTISGATIAAGSGNIGILARSSGSAKALFLSGSNTIGVAGGTTTIDGRSTANGWGTWTAVGTSIATAGTMSISGASVSGIGLGFCQSACGATVTASGALSITGRSNSFTALDVYGLTLTNSGSTPIALSGQSITYYGSYLTGTNALNGPISYNGTSRSSYGLWINFGAGIATTGTVSIGGSSISGAGLEFCHATNCGANITASGALSLAGSSVSTTALDLYGSTLATSGSGSISVAGSSSSGIGVYMAGSNTLTGPITLSGTSASNTGGFIAASSTLTTAGTVSLSGTSTSGIGFGICSWNCSGTVTATASGALTVNGTSTSFTGLDFYVSSLSATGSGSIALGGHSTSSLGAYLNGGHSINGTFSFSANSTSNTGTYVEANATLTSSGTATFTSISSSGVSLDLAGNNSFIASSGSLAVIGGSSGSSGIGIRGISALTLANNGAGGLSLSGISNGAQGISISGGSTLTGTGAVTLSGNGATSDITISDSGAINLASGAITGSGGHGISLTSSGGAIALGATTVASNAGALTLSAATTLSGSGTISANGAISITNGTAGTLSGAISGSGSLAKAGAATLTLSGANSYSGATTVSAGTLAAGSATALGSNSALTVASGATLDLAGNALSIGSLAGAGTVTNSSAGTITLTTGGLGTSTSFSGALQNGSGTLALTKTGAGTQTLSGSNNFRGALQVDAGTLALTGSWTPAGGNASSIVAGGATFSGSGTLTATSYTASGSGLVSLTGPNAVGTLAGSGTIGALTFNDTIALGLGGISTSGALALTNSGNLSIGSGVTISAGGSIALGVTGTATLTHAGTIGQTGSGSITLSSANGTIAAGSGSISQQGNGAISLVSTGSGVAVPTIAYSGSGASTLTISAGSAVTLDHPLTSTGGALATSVTGTTIALGTSITTSGGTLAFSGPVSLTDTGTLSAGTGSLSFSGAIDGGHDLTATASNITLGGALGGSTALGAVSLAAQQNLTLPSITAASLVARSTNSGAAITIGTGKTLTLSGGGTPLLLAADIFTNNAGSGAVSAPNGRWLIFSAAPSGDTFGSLDSANRAVWNTTYSGSGGTVSAGGNRYVFAYQPTVTFTSTSLSKSYGTDLSASLPTAYSVGGLQAGVANAYMADTAAIAFSGLPALSSPGAAANATVAGSPYAVTVSAGSLSGLNGYALAFSSAGTLTIGKAALTITAGDASKTYDGTAFAGGNGVAYSGFTNGDTASSLSGTLHYGGTAQGAIDAGTYGITASGLSSTDYDINWVPSTLTIGKAILTVTASNATKAYDGTAFVGGNGVTYSGFAGSDSASSLSGTITYGGTAQGAISAGSYGITASGLSGANYDINWLPGVLTLGKSVLTITANNASRTYDGTAFTGGNGVTYSGFISGDNASVLSGAISYGGSAQGAINAGSYGIAASGLSSANYDINWIPGILTVGKAPLTVTATNAARTYDGTAFTGGNGVTYSGFIGSDGASALAGTLSYGGTAQGAVNAGSYDITASGLSGTNYDIVWNPGTLTVGKAALTVTANNAAKAYDGTAFAGGNGVSYSGFANGDGVSSVSGALTYGGTAQGATATGSYSITASGLTSANYDISWAPGTLTIGKSILTITASDISKIYDGTAFSGGSGVIYAGFINGDGASVLTGTLSYGGTAQGATGAGRYSITASGLSSANYDINWVPGTLTVGKAALTITARDTARVYEGTAFTGGNGVTYSGLVAGDAASVLSGTLRYGGSAQGATDAGRYTITASGLTSANYDISWAPGTLTIDRAPLSITANDAHKIYDGAAFTGGGGLTFTGLAQGEDASTLSGTLSFGGTAQGATNAGLYTITASGLSSTNYDIQWQAGTLTVDKAPLTITAGDASKTYDGVAFSGGKGVTYAGFVRDENASSLAGVLSYAGTAQGATNAGGYAIMATGLSSPNYDIQWTPGTLTIAKAPLTASANDASKTYDGTAFSGGGGVSFAGFAPGDDAARLSGVLAYGGTAQGATGAGNYVIAAGGLASPNYDITWQTGSLTIFPLPAAPSAMSTRIIFQPNMRSGLADQVGTASAARHDDAPVESDDETAEEKGAERDGRRRTPSAQFPSQRRDRSRFALLDPADPLRR